MTAPALKYEPVVADEQTAAATRDLQQALLAAGSGPLRLVTSAGQSLILPEPVDHALRAIIAAFAMGDSVTILPQQQQLTTNQAARLLNISRPHLVTLLERGKIPHSLTGTHRRLQLTDVLDYKERRDRTATAHLDAILAEAQESDGYF